MAGAAGQFDRTAGGPKRKPGQTVYTLPSPQAEDPKPVEIRTGITDGRFTQVASGSLKAGDTVVTGLVTTKAETMQQRPPGMGGGPAGGGRRF
jgi:multidrug efflux pump subunit AcrA (membrane-fusion protein)